MSASFSLLSPQQNEVALSAKEDLTKEALAMEEKYEQILKETAEQTKSVQEQLKAVQTGEEERSKLRKSQVRITS
jgi:hypothetical protein